MPELSAIEELYRDVVLDHYRNPRNRTALEAADGRALVHNPLCGDQVQVEVKLADGRIREVSARTRGCSIAVAAGSVMTELVRDLDPTQAEVLHQQLTSVVEGAPAPDDLDRRLRAFARVAELPSRRRCATLPWEALAEAMQEGGRS